MSDDEVSVHAPSWSENTEAEWEKVKDGDDSDNTMDEIDDDTWMVVDEIEEEECIDNQEETEKMGVQEVETGEIEKMGIKEVETEEKEKKGIKEETEKMGVKITFNPTDERERSIEVSHLASDIRLKSIYHKSAPLGPSGDREPVKFTVNLPATNKLPRGIKSYERLPKEMLPDGMKFCYICGIPKKSHMKRHILRTHVPWFWSPTLACWQCEQQTCQQSSMIHHHNIEHNNNAEFLDEENLHKWCFMMNGAMFLLVKWLRLDTLDDLFQYIKSREIRARGVFSANETRCMTFYCQNYSDKVPTSFSIDPPNHIICIVHFEIIVRLQKKISTDERLQEFVNSQTHLTSEGLEVITTNLFDKTTSHEFIDSHFHLDALIKKLSSNTYHRKTFEDVENMLAKMHTHKLLMGIANYVYPNNWSLWEDQVGNSRIKVSFGIHPHMAAYGISNSRWRELNKLIQNSKCVAVGETGIDATTSCDCLTTLDHCYTPEACRERISAYQEESLKIHLQLAAQFDKPVILHCRDHGDGTSASRVLEIIRQYNFTNLSFHRHCFVGTISEFDEWNLLPRIKFGICVGVTKNKAQAQLENIIPKISDNKFILETDSPYLPMSKASRINHPWNLIHAAEFVARLRNVPVSFILNISNQNCRDLYRL